MSDEKPMNDLPLIALEEVEKKRWDAVVIGAGHNALVAASMLAKAGRSVVVVERSGVIGGACRTERPFARAPELATSTGAYLLGLMPPELMAHLGLELPILRRDPHYFLPTTGSRHLLFGSDTAALEQQFRTFFSSQDYAAHLALSHELDMLRDDVAKTWLEPPLSIEETAERYVRAPLRDAFIALCRGTISDYLERFDFKSDLVKAMYAVTDAFSGVCGGLDTPGTGMNFLVHNMCRLPGSAGTWMIVRGGMGTVTHELARTLGRAGGRIVLDAPVVRVVLDGGAAAGVELQNGAQIRAHQVLAGSDPFTLRELTGAEHFGPELNARLDAMKRPGSTLKLNLALERLPTFSCLPEDRGQFSATIHLLPDENQVLSELGRAFAAAQRGELPPFPAIEWYVHSTVDPSLKDGAGRLSSALFVQWVPYEIAGSSWDQEAEAYADHLLSICDRFAPGTSSLVADRMVLHPKAIEERFGMRYGHIHHIDNTFGFADRFPHRTPVPGLYSCSAGTHPAGSVIGCAGFIAAELALADA